MQSHFGAKAYDTSIIKYSQTPPTQNNIGTKLQQITSHDLESKQLVHYSDQQLKADKLSSIQMSHFGFVIQVTI